MAIHHNYFYIFFMLFCAFSYSSFAYQLIVGGKDGWVPKPSENYNHWAQRLRFNVNDTLLFKYKKGSNSVMVVNRDDYEKCNTQNPIMKMDDGDSIFKFNRSGLLYFISGNKTNCDQGQKIIILVLAVRNRHSPPSPNASAPASSPAEAPGGGDAAGHPPRRSFAPAAFTSSVLLVSTVSIVLSGFIVSY